MVTDGRQGAHMTFNAGLTSHMDAKTSAFLHLLNTMTWMQCNTAPEWHFFCPCIVYEYRVPDTFVAICSCDANSNLAKLL